MTEKKYIIHCTPRAVQKAREQIEKRNNANTKGIRLGLRGGGCNGFSIMIEFADKTNEKDHIFEFDGVSLYVDPKSIVYLDGTTIDYEVSLMGSGFKFNMPNQKSTCGCGESISF